MKRQSSRASFLYTKKEKSMYSAGSAVTKKLGESVASVKFFFALDCFFCFTLSCTLHKSQLMIICF